MTGICKLIMKSKNKTIVVKCGSWSSEENVDQSIFDDVMIEACTRALEKNIRAGNFIVTPCIQANEKNKNKLCVFNTYKILINGGFYRLAETLRETVMKSSKVDLKKEPIKD